ncbi:MAG TPA: FUN14 domain-containing protein, partial [Methanomicrobiales archaeon]|nr:FUN14 domain-containing protein [Methanomicrobiales archaeon]
MTMGVGQVLGPGLSQFSLNLGGAAAVGGLTGWTTKKLVKVVAVLVGLGFAGLAYLAQQGVISIRWGRLNQMLIGSEQAT